MASMNGIYLTDFVGQGGIEANDLIQQIDGEGEEPITLYVNSPGGDVFDGMSIMNALRNHPSRVEAQIMGLAGSIASVIVAGGADKVTMNKGARIMIHEPYMSTYGTAAMLRDDASTLDSVRADIVDVYQQRMPNIERDAIEAMMKQETWWNADSAIEYGFADKSSPEIAARWDKFRTWMAHARIAPPKYTQTEEENDLQERVLEEIVANARRNYLRMTQRYTSE